MKKQILWVLVALFTLSMSCNALVPGSGRIVTQTSGSEPATPSGRPTERGEAVREATATLQARPAERATATDGADQPTEAAAPTGAPRPTAARAELRRTATPAQPTATQRAPVAAPEIQGEVGERSIGDDYIPELGNTGYDVLGYTIQIALDPKVAEVPAAIVTVVAAATVDPLAQFSLDFIGFTIDSLTFNGEEAAWEREGTKLVITPPAPVGQSETFTVIVAYHGEPVFEASPYVPFDDHVGLFFRTKLNRAYVVSEPDGARYWFPCNDHPRDKATFRIEVTVPEALVGVSNGTLVDTLTEIPNAFPDGRAGDRFSWVEGSPMATYLATVAVGDYVRVEGVTAGGVKLRSYVFPNQRAQMEALTPAIGEALDWMSAQFGPYPFDEFGYVTVNGLGGALETQSMVILGALDEEMMVHELAHMWFGDWVSLDSWGEIWRNEGFATYVTALWFDENDTTSLGSQARMWQLAFDGRSPFPLNDPPPANMFSLESYYGGALMVHALREEMGDEAFFNGLRSYLQRYADSAASDAQFQAEMEAAAGRDLSGFFGKWLR